MPARTGPPPQGYTSAHSMGDSIFQGERGRLLAWIALTLLALTALASGLGSLEIRSSNLMGTQAAHEIAGLLDQLMPGSALSALSFLAGFLRLIVFVLLPFSIFYFLKSPEVRKRVLIQVLYLIGFSYSLLVLARNLGSFAGETSAPLLPVYQASPSTLEITPGLSEAPGWMLVAVAALVTLLLLALSVWIIRTIRAKDRPIDAVGEAQWALNAIGEGVELENVIFRAYHRLCTLSSSRYGISRARGMTPKEYERVLARSDMPEWALSRLTRLFEKARYGALPLSSSDEEGAIEALQAIVGESA